jgi:hypothetical protein
MEKIQSIRKGNIWLNVFKTENGQILAAVNKSFMNKDGQWNQTPFLNARRGDIRDLMDALSEFHEFEKLIEVEGLGPLNLSCSTSNAPPPPRPTKFNG